MDYLVSQFAHFYESLILITTPLFLLLGFGLAFYGLIVSRVVAYLIGFFWGAVLGGAAGYLLGGGLAALVCALFLGMIVGAFFLFSAINLPKIIGFFAASLPVYLLVQPEGWGLLIPILAGLAGGWLGGFVDRMFIIFTSALCGSWMLTSALVRAFAATNGAFHGDLFDALQRFGFLTVALFSITMTLGVLQQYGIIHIFSLLTRWIHRQASDYTLDFETQESGTDAFFLYAVNKRDLDSPSLGYLRCHAFGSWLFALVFLSLSPGLLYTAHAFRQHFDPSLVSGWIMLKGVLCFFLAIYFGVAFYQGIRGLNSSPIPEWSVRITFFGGLVLGFLWLFCGLTPLAQGIFDADILLSAALFLPMYLQYRRDRKAGRAVDEQLDFETAISG